MQEPKFKLRLSVSEQTKTAEFSPSDVGLSVEEWSSLTEDEKRDQMHEFIGGFDQPSWDLERVEEIK